MIDNSDFYMFKEQVNRIYDILQRDEEEDFEDRELVGKLSTKVSSMKRHWQSFGDYWREYRNQHNLSSLEDYGADVNGDTAKWKSSRDHHEQIDLEGENNDMMERKPNQFIEITVTYLDTEDGPLNYALRVEDDLYDLTVKTEKQDIQGIIATLIDLSSKFDFRDVVDIEKGNVDINIQQINDNLSKMRENNPNNKW